MIKKYEIIDFRQVNEKINKPITKFGGQPIFIHKQKWPYSAGWEGRKMMFVGQIMIEENMLGNDKKFIVYIFVTHPESYQDDFFDPDTLEWMGGENEVIIQTFEDNDESESYPLQGPTLFDKNNDKHEYIPIIKEGYDTDFLTNEEFRKLDSNQQKEIFELIDTNKIGGVPNFFRKDAWPEGEWILLLQLKCNFLPFTLRLGGDPVLYVFVSKDLTKAGLLVQD